MRLPKRQSKIVDDILDDHRSTLREDLARGIPDFAFQEVAKDASDGMKRHLQRYILLVTSDAKTRNKMTASANVMLRKLEEELREKLEEKFQDFLKTI